MGASITTNTTNQTMDALSKVSTSVMNKGQSGTDQNIFFKLRSNTGNINISNNKGTQIATVDTDQLLTAITSADVQQELAQQVSQIAKSLTSGINFGNVSYANNNANEYMKSTMDVVTNIKNICKNSIKQKVDIDVATNSGNITLNNNNFSQVAKIFGKCVANALAQSNLKTDMSQKTIQEASATTKGLSLDGIIIAAIIGLIVMGLTIAVPVGLGITKIFKYICPILFIVGVALLVTYFLTSKTILTVTKFSTGLSNPACNAKASKNVVYSTAEAMGTACQSDPNCEGYDWYPGNSTKSTIYSSIGVKDCSLQSDTPPNPPYVTIPTVYIGSGNPSLSSTKIYDFNNKEIESSTLKVGDIYIDKGQGFGDVYPYILSNKTPKWQQTASTNIFKEAKVDNVDTNKPLVIVPASSPPFTKYVSPPAYVVNYGLKYTSIELFDIEKKGDDKNSDNGSTSLGTITIHAVPQVPGEDDVPWSGIKVVQRNNIFLVLAICFMAIGLIGTIAAFVSGRKKNDKTEIKDKPSSSSFFTIPDKDTRDKLI